MIKTNKEKKELLEKHVRRSVGIAFIVGAGLITFYTGLLVVLKFKNLIDLIMWVIVTIAFLVSMTLFFKEFEKLKEVIEDV